MYSAPRSIQAVALAFVYFVSGSAAFPQTPKFIRRTADPLPLANVRLAPPRCAGDSRSPAADLRATIVLAEDATSTCDSSPRANASLVNPCNSSSGVRIGCHVPRDVMQENLNALGKPGQKILRARERVLEILETENACSAWFREMDSNPGAIFRTLHFALDLPGEHDVRESRDSGAVDTLRSPYVAKVFQGEGRYATITINGNGAFFSSLATVIEISKEGGPSNFRGVHLLRVGPYMGNTLPAQVVALLHEFGHVIDLLPRDGDDQDGKSAQNTSEVLRFCRAAVESKGKRSTLSAAR